MSGSYVQNCGSPCTTDEEVLTYDGNGLLLKSAISHQEDEEAAETDTNYSIRSSVLQGEVISTVNKSGGISATYIRASGTVVAVENVSTTALWMHKDPAMNSMRSTNASGQANGSSLGGDFDALELDPTGKSLGFEDPYANGVPAPEAGFVEPFESFGAIVNGQFTTFTVDGVQVPRKHFDQMTEFAFQGFFGAVERQSRLSAPRLSHLQVGDRRFNADLRGANQALNEVIELDGGTIVRHWSVSNGWAMNGLISGQTQPQRREDTPEIAAQKALNEASARLLARGNCRTKIEELLRKAALHRFNEAGGGYDKLSPEAKAAVDKDIVTAFSAEAVMASLNSTNPVYKPKDFNLGEGNNHTKASISRPGGILTLTFYAGFYGQISDGKTGIRVNDQKQDPYVSGSTSLEDRALSVIHEGIHAFDPNFTDGFIGRIIKGKDKDLSKSDGSKAINEYVEKHCR